MGRFRVGDVVEIVFNEVNIRAGARQIYPTGVSGTVVSKDANERGCVAVKFPKHIWSDFMKNKLKTGEGVTGTATVATKAKTENKTILLGYDDGVPDTVTVTVEKMEQVFFVPEQLLKKVPPT